jgi:CheY-like chemotaxis protein
VVIVDDEGAVARLLGAQLEKAGYQVVIETDADSALRRLSSSEPVDLVYCDLMMKGRSGMELAASLPPARQARVVFMTGGAFTTGAQTFRQTLGHRCVDKPFDIVTETARRLQEIGAA